LRLAALAAAGVVTLLTLLQRSAACDRTVRIAAPS